MAPLAPPRRILLVKLRAIGDAVLTLPSLQALHAGFPQAAITVLCPPASAAVYAGDPRVAELLVYDRPRLRRLADHARLWQDLQAERFDLAVCLHASFRSALLGWGSGAPARSIRNHSGPDWFSTLRAAEPKEPKSIIQRDFDALRACGLEPRDERPRMFLTPAAKAAAERRWKVWGIRGKVVLYFPGAGKPEKRWPRERFIGLARSLKAVGRRPVFLTGPGEDGLGVEARLLGGVWDQVADLKELGALCAKAGAVIGNDSGPRHIAAASGARTLTLFGPETLREWHPYRREQGHWAVQPESGDIGALELGPVVSAARAWLKGKSRG